MKLMPMSEKEYDFWAPRSIQHFAEDKIKANAYTPKEAQRLAQSSFEQHLPNGMQSQNNFLFTLKNDESEILGYLWYGLMGDDGNQKAWLCDIVIEEPYRGKGFGKKAMALFEADVKSRGIHRTGLHVFAFNKAACGLYKSLDYMTTDLVMEKSLK